jgi:hypothetical protein
MTTNGQPVSPNLRQKFAEELQHCLETHTLPTSVLYRFAEERKADIAVAEIAVVLLNRLTECPDCSAGDFSNPLLLTAAQ